MHSRVAQFVMARNTWPSSRSSEWHKSQTKSTTSWSSKGSMRACWHPLLVRGHPRHMFHLRLERGKEEVLLWHLSRIMHLPRESSQGMQDQASAREWCHRVKLRTVRVGAQASSQHYQINLVILFADWFSPICPCYQRHTAGTEPPECFSQSGHRKP